MIILYPFALLSERSGQMILHVRLNQANLVLVRNTLHTLLNPLVEFVSVLEQAPNGMAHATSPFGYRRDLRPARRVSSRHEYPFLFLGHRPVGDTASPLAPRRGVGVEPPRHFLIMHHFWQNVPARSGGAAACPWRSSKGPTGTGLARFWRLGLNFPPEILMADPFSCAYLLFGHIKNPLKLGRISQ